MAQAVNTDKNGIGANAHDLVSYFTESAQPTMGSRTASAPPPIVMPSRLIPRSISRPTAAIAPTASRMATR
jgi:hypothetical protein